MPRGLRSPQTFFGRDSELAQIIDMIFSHVGSRPARIAILGSGGYGKTTLANAVLTHAHVQEYFGDARYFVACESVFSPGALLMEIAKTLGVFDGATDVLWSRIRTALSSKECIICLDNFESPWDQDGDTRNSVEDLLSRIAELQRVTLLITIRGTVRPAQTQWTVPLLPPLTTLGRDAARRVWEHTSDNYDVYAEELTKAVNYVPLAVSLLAHLAQATPPELLLTEWNEKHTEFIHTNHTDRQSDLDYSIQLSINSGRMRGNPSARELLGVLSMLPDGIHKKWIKRFQEILRGIDILSGLRTLHECSLICMVGERYQTHPIIRKFCNNHALISEERVYSLRDFYLKLASTRPFEAQASTHAEMVLEVNNTQTMLFGLINLDAEDHTKQVHAISSFTLFCSSIGDHSDKLISQTVTVLRQKNASPSLIIRCLETWGRLHCHSSNLTSAKYKLQEAERLCKSGQENKSTLHASIFYWLGEVNLLQYTLDEAITSFQKALRFHKHANDIIGQGDDYSGLGKTYIRLNKFQEAEAAYSKALTFHELGNNTLGQGDDHRSLGQIYFKLNRLQEAKASYNKALQFHKLGNSALGQGNDYHGLGDIHVKLNNLNEAQHSYHQALEFHKLANVILNQGNDYHGLGNTYLRLNQLNDAKASFNRALEFHQLANDTFWQGNDSMELGNIYFDSKNLKKAQASFHKALKAYELSNSVLGQANALQKLGRVQLAGSQLHDAKTLFENALKMHKQGKDVAGQKLDQDFLNKVLFKIRRRKGC